MKNKIIVAILACVALSCSSEKKEKETSAEVKTKIIKENEMARTEIYAPVKLTTDISKLSEEDKKIIPILIEAATLMDEIFWLESNPESIMIDIEQHSKKENTFYTKNYGPWDRLNGNDAFISGVAKKPFGANYYPTDMTKQEFEAWDQGDKKSLYTMIRRNDDGTLISIPFNAFFKTQNTKTSDLLKKAAKISTDEELKNYLNLRAAALLTDNYDESDIAWLDMKNNTIDIIIGPIENYEDKLYGYKAAHESYVLVKDKEWSQRLEKYVSYLPELQNNLPVEQKYKAEQPGRDAQLNAYDVVYYAGDCNAGSKTIAVNLPNDEEIQKSKGTRRSQLKNAMKAKFDKILVPIANELIVESQVKHITFEAFFGNTMFHEVAHGLGIKNTINDKGTAREALKEKYSALEEGKADILGLYMVTYLFDKGVYTEGVLMDNYVTFLAGIFRSVRFGAASAHGKANMLRFNFFKEKGAFTIDEKSGKYQVDFDKMKIAMNELSAIILKLQGDGDYEGVGDLMAKKGNVGADLQMELDKLTKKAIPVDVVFEQGVEVLGL